MDAILQRDHSCVNAQESSWGETPLQTPLMHVVRNGSMPCSTPERRIQIAQMLLDHSADLDIQDGNGKTALHIALGDLDMIMTRWLHQNGASADICDSSGRTAVDIGQESMGQDPIHCLKHTQTGETKKKSVQCRSSKKKSKRKSKAPMNVSKPPSVDIRQQAQAYLTATKQLETSLLYCISPDTAKPGASSTSPKSGKQQLSTCGLPDCLQPASSQCSRCKSEWYCSRY